MAIGGEILPGERFTPTEPLVARIMFDGENEELVLIKLNPGEEITFEGSQILDLDQLYMFWLEEKTQQGTVKHQVYLSAMQIKTLARL